MACWRARGSQNRPCMDGNRNSSRPPPAEQRFTLKLRGGPGANPTLTLQQSPDPTESGQRSPEPVRAVEVRQRCDTNDATHNPESDDAARGSSVAAESDMPGLFPACSTPGLVYPGRDHSREGQAPSISSPRRDLDSSVTVRKSLGNGRSLRALGLDSCLLNILNADQA